MLGIGGSAAGVAKELRRDLEAARARDPAACKVARLEIVLTWAGIQALLAHRLAHALHEAGVPVLPRLIAFLARMFTGVEIHPAARRATVLGSIEREYTLAEIAICTRARRRA